jgi:predicted aspartyl protease
MWCVLIPLIPLISSVTCGAPTPTQSKNLLLAEIGFEKEFGGIAVLAGSVNARGTLKFLLDTGGSGSVIDKDLAIKLGLNIENAVASVSGNPSMEVGVVRDAAVHVGSIQFHRQLMATPLSQLEEIFGCELDGILGGDFVRRYVVELDYERDLMRIYDPTGFQYEGAGTALQLSFVEGIPYVELKLALPNGKSVIGTFLVDTGGDMPALLNKQIVDRDGLADQLPTLNETGYGLGGKTARVALRASTLSIGPFELERPFVGIANDPARADQKATGLIGMEVLRRFKVTFDYSRSRMYLKPGPRVGEAFVYDASGLALRARRPSFSPYVSRVTESSPAQEAGLKPGDLLLELDGRSTPGLSLEVIRHVLKDPGNSHTLTLSRSGKTIKTVLRTRERLN